MPHDPNEPYCEDVDEDDVMLDQEFEEIDDGVDDDDEYCEYYDPDEDDWG